MKEIETETKEMIELLRSKDCNMCPIFVECENTDNVTCLMMRKAADRLEEQEQSIEEWIQIFDILNDRENRHHYLEYWREQNGESDLTYPDGDQIYKDFFAMKADRDHLLKIAKKMHLWIFHNTCDEYAAYKECGLTDEDDARLGYGGQFVLTVEGKSEDGDESES